jgi:hypothetical protein
MTQGLSVVKIGILLERHANAAAHRAVITIAANPPSRGGTWVMRTTAPCGNVIGADAGPGSGIAAGNFPGSKEGKWHWPIRPIRC